MQIVASLLAYVLAYSAFLVVLPATNPVPQVSWLALLALGLIVTVVLQLQSRWSVSARSWVLCAIYVALLASLFFGADFALSALGTSVKPRAELPAFLNGLELYYLLVPGVASVALGVAVGAWLKAYQQRRHVKPSASGLSEGFADPALQGAAHETHLDHHRCR